MPTQIEKSQNKILQQSAQLSSLSKQLEACELSHEQLKRSLLQKHEDHLEALSSIHKTEKLELERQLHEQRNIKERIEAERDKAVDASEEAARKDRDTMIQLDQMSAMIEEGKTLIAANEKLHKSLHLEIDKRKALHNKFEDQKGRIRFGCTFVFAHSAVAKTRRVAPKRSSRKTKGLASSCSIVPICPL